MEKITEAISICTTRKVIARITFRDRHIKLIIGKHYNGENKHISLSVIENSNISELIEKFKLIYKLCLKHCKFTKNDEGYKIDNIRICKKNYYSIRYIPFEFHGEWHRYLIDNKTQISEFDLSVLLNNIIIRIISNSEYEKIEEYKNKVEHVIRNRIIGIVE